MILFASHAPDDAQIFSREHKLGANTTSLRMLGPQDSLRNLEGILEDSHGLGQFLSRRHVFVTSEGSRIPPLEFERDHIIRPKSAPV